MRKLYIIGNGFDKAHGLNTDYMAFRQYLEENQPNFLMWFENIYGLVMPDFDDPYMSIDEEEWDEIVSYNLWSELEKQLAYPGIEDMLDMACDTVESMDLESGPIGIKDTLDYHWRAQYGFIEELPVHLKSWIKRINIRDLKPMNDDLVDNDTDAFFSFNYTRVLEEVYGIPKVYHVHGSIDSVLDDDLIIGHCNDKEIKERRELCREAEWRGDEGDASIQNAIADFLEHLHKDTAFLLRWSQRFFASLTDVDQVIVIGWSAGEVDLPYLEAIRDSVSEKTKWTVYYYAKNPADKYAYNQLKEAFEKCGISDRFQVEYDDSKNFWK